MQVEELKGKLVLFKFSEDIRPDLSLFQIFKDELWAVVTGIDDVGIWIENPLGGRADGGWISRDAAVICRSVADAQTDAAVGVDHID